MNIPDDVLDTYDTIIKYVIRMRERAAWCRGRDDAANYCDDMMNIPQDPQCIARQIRGLKFLYKEEK